MYAMIARCSRALCILALVWAVAALASGGRSGRLAAQSGPTMKPDPVDNYSMIGDPPWALFIRGENMVDLTGYQFSLNYNGRTTLADAASQGATSVSVNEDVLSGVPVPAPIMLDPNDIESAEQAMVTGKSGSGPYTYDLHASIGYDHAAGAVVHSPAFALELPAGARNGSWTTLLNDTAAGQSSLKVGRDVLTEYSLPWPLIVSYGSAAIEKVTVSSKSVGISSTTYYLDAPTEKAHLTGALVTPAKDWDSLGPGTTPSTGNILESTGREASCILIRNVAGSLTYGCFTVDPQCGDIPKTTLAQPAPAQSTTIYVTTDILITASLPAPIVIGFDTAQAEGAYVVSKPTPTRYNLQDPTEFEHAAGEYVASYASCSNAGPSGSGVLATVFFSPENLGKGPLDLDPDGAPFATFLTQFPAGQITTLNGLTLTDGSATLMTCPDLDGNGWVNLMDVFQLAPPAWNAMPGEPGWDPNKDLDGNGWINLMDIFVIGQFWNRTCP